MTAAAASPAADEVRGGGAIDPGVLGAGVPGAGALEFGAAIGAAGLALTSTGSMVVAAVFLGVATRSRWSLAALLLAVGAVGVRFSTVTFDDIAGIQSVLGSAGTIGPPTAAASAWTAAAAVLAALRVAPGRALVLRGAVALAGGAMAAAIAVGPGPGGAVVQRVAATAVATVVAFALVTPGGSARPSRLRATAAVLAGVAAVVLAGWPS